VDTLLGNRWGTFALRAAVAALFGGAVLAQQDLSLGDFSRWFGVAVVVNGLLALGATVVRFEAGNPWGDPGWDGTPTFAIDPPWRPLAAEGVLSFVTGLVVLVTPVTRERPLFGVIAAVALAAGVAQGLTAVQLDRLAAGWVAMGICAAVSIGTGVLVLATDALASPDRMKIVAVAALVEAAALTAIGAELRSLTRAVPVPQGTTVLAAELIEPIRSGPRAYRQRPAAS
jgi:uncharacterized membrane protein HdeD (DUF308 family)